MQYKETAVSLDTVERERERERESIFSQIGFVCVAKNRIDEKIKRIDYEVKPHIGKMCFNRNSLSFLRACEVIESKDKYAWESLTLVTLKDKSVKQWW